ncbi:MAG: EAL domain-containing protein, partial [Rhodospirillales bacterium]|nr:EAL domain-containing protein [Rhodospirillales bacterium]
NRTQFQAKLKEAIEQAKRTGRVVGLMLLDLDHFKDVNDTLGHPAGDALLKQVSGRLQECLRATDTVARLGGDEFAVIATNCTDVEGVTLLADRIVEDLARPFVIEDSQIHTGTSIGITIFPQDSENSDQLLRNADLALYRAKGEGRGTWRIYDEQMNVDVQTQRQLEEDLHRALDREELEVAYQPRYNIVTGEIVGAEALLRWSHAERGTIPPDQFIPVAESTGTIVSITQWLLREVCARNRQWQDSGLSALCLSINLSPVHFKHREIVEQVAEALLEAGLEPECLELEITEGMAMAGGESSLHLVHELKKLGVKLSIDDFGTGYSSLDRLKKFPIDCLKIDRSFVCDIMTDVNDAAICSAAIRLGHSLNIRVLAEGVETEEQLAFLIEQGCEEAQGFLLSRPLGAEDFVAFLREGGRPADPGIFARAAEVPPASPPAELLTGES